MKCSRELGPHVWEPISASLCSGEVMSGIPVVSAVLVTLLLNTRAHKELAIRVRCQMQPAEAAVLAQTCIVWCKTVLPGPNPSGLLLHTNHHEQSCLLTTFISSTSGAVDQQPAVQVLGTSCAQAGAHTCQKGARTAPQASPAILHGRDPVWPPACFSAQKPPSLRQHDLRPESRSQAQDRHGLQPQEERRRDIRSI